MPFDMAAFEHAQFEPRLERVHVPALEAFFPAGDKPEWVVRGLTVAELNRASEAERRQRDMGAVADALASAGDKAKELRKVLGLADGTPADIAKALEMVVAGSVEPKIELHQAVKLGETFPIEFLLIARTITKLTGLGFDLVKPAAASRPSTASTPP